MGGVDLVTAECRIMLSEALTGDGKDVEVAQ